MVCQSFSFIKKWIGKGGKEQGSVFVPFMKVAVPSDIIEEILGSFYT